MNSKRLKREQDIKAILEVLVPKFPTTIIVKQTGRSQATIALWRNKSKLPTLGRRTNIHSISKYKKEFEALGKLLKRQGNNGSPGKVLKMTTAQLMQEHISINAHNLLCKAWV